MKNQEFIKNLSTELKPFGFADSLSTFLIKWSGYTVLVAILAYMFLPARADVMVKMSSMSFHLENILWFVASISSGVAFYFSSFPQKLKRAFWIPVIFSLSILLLLILSHFNSDNFAHELHNEMSLWRGRCGLIILTISMIHATFLGRWAKKAAPRDVGMTGLWAALSASSMGCLFMQIVCTHQNSLHLLIWHFLPLAAICFAGQKLGQRYLHW
jgi:hypothetical protein